MIFIVLLLSLITSKDVSAHVTGYVIRVDGNIVYLDIGANHLGPETMLAVHRAIGKGQETDVVIGLVKVTQVFPNVSVGHVVRRRGDSYIRVLDRVTTDVESGFSIDDMAPVSSWPSKIVQLRPLLPGAEQIVQNKRRGALIGVGTMATLAGGIATRQISDRFYSDYRKDPLKESKARNHANLFRSISNGLFLTAGSIYLYNLIDGYLLRGKGMDMSIAPGEDLRIAAYVRF
jgi:hypothetical protein